MAGGWAMLTAPPGGRCIMCWGRRAWSWNCCRLWGRRWWKGGPRGAMPGGWPWWWGMPGRAPMGRAMELGGMPWGGAVLTDIIGWPGPG